MQDLSGPKIRTGPLAGRPAVHAARRASTLRIAAGDQRRRVAGRGLHALRRADRIGAARRSAAARRRPDRAAGGRARRRRARCTVVVNGGPLGEHKGINAPGRGRCPPSALTDEGRRRICASGCARRRSRRAQLRADGRTTCQRRARSHRRAGAIDAAHREDRAAGGGRESRRDSRRGARRDGGAGRSRARDAARAGAARAEGDHPARAGARACR